MHTVTLTDTHRHTEFQKFRHRGRLKTARGFQLCRQMALPVVSLPRLLLLSRQLSCLHKSKCKVQPAECKVQCPPLLPPPPPPRDRQRPRKKFDVKGGGGVGGSAEVANWGRYFSLGRGRRQVYRVFGTPTAA